MTSRSHEVPASEAHLHIGELMEVPQNGRIITHPIREVTVEYPGWVTIEYGTCRWVCRDTDTIKITREPALF